MEYAFRLPDGRTFAVQSWGNMAVELAAELAGVKPTLQVWVQSADEAYLDELCAAFGLRKLVYARQGDPGALRLGVMLGKDPAQVEEAARVWQTPRSNPGPQLGYPPCCSDFYCAWLDDPSAATGPDVITRIFAHTPRPVGLPFLTNDAFYLYSRRPSAGDPERREAVARLNRGIDMNVLNVLPWHPCSYRCAASLKAGRAIWKVMQTRAPSLAATIRAALPHPVVFWDWDRFAVLRGAGARGVCAYEGIAAPYAPLEAERAELLKSGDAIRHERGRSLSVYKGKKKLAELPGALLLDFTSATR